MRTALFSITLLFLLHLSMSCSSSSSSSTTKKDISDASGKACTSIVREDRTIAYDFCFNTLTKSKSADLKSLAGVAVSHALIRIKRILNKLNQLKDGVVGEDELDRYQICLASYNRLNSYVTSAGNIITGKTNGDAKTNLRNAIAHARISVDKCENHLTRSQSSFSVGDKKVEPLVKIAVEVLNMVNREGKRRLEKVYIFHSPCLQVDRSSRHSFIDGIRYAVKTISFPLI